MVKRAQNRSEKIQKMGAAIAKNLSGNKTVKQRSATGHLMNRFWSDLRRGSSSARANGWNGRFMAAVVGIALVVSMSVVGTTNAQPQTPSSQAAPQGSSQSPGEQAPPPGQAKFPTPTPAAPNRQGLREAPVTNITVDGSEAMFTTMCALLAAGFESQVSSDGWSPFRTQIRDRMEHAQGPAVDALREFYQKHELNDPGAMLSQYIWFGLVSGPAPNFKPTMKRDDLPPEVITLEGFPEILSKFYVEQHIGRIWVQV